MPGDVITIFNHGTGSHRNRHDGEIISIFGRCMYEGNVRADGGRLIRGSDEYMDYVITDGPGSDTDLYGAKYSTYKDKYNPMPGKFVPDFDIDLLQGERENYEDDPPPMKREKAKPKRVTTVSGAAKGEGWEDNVCHIISFFEWLDDTNELPRIVNMIGWSRGAVTCFQQAEAIYNYVEHKKRHKENVAWQDQYPRQERFRGIDINIFAIDPVAGEGNRHYDVNRMIYPNVKNLVVTLAMHEKRTGFEPQDFTSIGKDESRRGYQIANLRTTPGPRLMIQDESITSYAVLPFPGQHNTQVRRYLSSDESGEDARAIEYFGYRTAQEQMTGPSMVVWNLAWAFLNHHGTVFLGSKSIRYNKNGQRMRNDFAQVLNEFMGDDPNRNAEKLLEEYTRMVINMPCYYKFLSNKSNVGNRLQSVPRSKTKVRHFMGQLPVYVKHPGYFVNEHHRWLFRSLYPDLYQDLENNIEQYGVNYGFGGVGPENGSEGFLEMFGDYARAAQQDAEAYAAGKLYREPNRGPSNDEPQGWREKMKKKMANNGEDDGLEDMPNYSKNERPFRQEPNEADWTELFGGSHIPRQVF